MEVKKVVNFGDTKGSAKFAEIMKLPYSMHKEELYSQPGYKERYRWESNTVTPRGRRMCYIIDVYPEERRIRYEPLYHTGFYNVCLNSDDFDELYAWIKSQVVSK